MATNSPFFWRRSFKGNRTNTSLPANLIHWWVIGLACVLHHQELLTRSIVKYIYQRYRPLVADDLLSPRKKIYSNLSLFLMVLIFPFFLQKQLRHSQQQQGVRVVFKSKATTQQDVDLNKTALFTGFPVNAVKFTFWWDWKPLQSRVREYDLAKPCPRLSRLKMGLRDCAINENSVDGGRGICHLFCPLRGGFYSSRVPASGNLPSKAKNC